MLLFFTALLHSQDIREIRKPVVNGMFYPADAGALTDMIDEYLSHAEKVVDGEIRGLVAPHAGYVYSGPVAAWSYKQVQGKSYDVVVVIAPSHFAYFDDVSVYPGDAYETPLGDIPIAKDLAKELTEVSEVVKFSGKGHDNLSRGRGEHSLEVQLPFLQRTLGTFRLLPLVVADQSWENMSLLGKALEKVLKGKNVLIVASSDLSHYRSYSEAYKMDKVLLDLFGEFKYRKLLEDCEDRITEACGYGPISVMMYTCSLLGAKNARVIKYATSGDVPVGEKQQVVGYMSGAIY